MQRSGLFGTSGLGLVHVCGLEGVGYRLQVSSLQARLQQHKPAFQTYHIIGFRVCFDAHTRQYQARS